MVFKRFVEVGRVIIINYGPLVGKLAVIVDILTTTKVLVQGLKGGVRRQELSLNRVTLTDEKIDIQRNAKKEAVAKALADSKVEEKIKKSKLGQKAELREKRANLTDFDRFKIMRLRQKRAVLRHLAVKGIAKKGGEKKGGEKKGEGKKGGEEGKGDNAGPHKAKKPKQKKEKENK